MLDINWYYTIPIDFEYKNYILLNYLSEIDASYAQHKLSPYLLYTEKMIIELNNFNHSLFDLKLSLKKDILGFNSKGIIYSKPETIKEIEEIKEIVEYSLPLLESKIKVGYKLFNKYPQLLY